MIIVTLYGVPLLSAVRGFVYVSCDICLTLGWFGLEYFTNGAALFLLDVPCQLNYSLGGF